MRRIFCISFLTLSVLYCVSATFVNGQEGREMVKFTPDFRFREGIYMNFEQVRLNNPVPKAKILTSADYNDKDFFKKILSSDKIYFYDGMGLRQEMETSSIWGYSRNGVLYIQVQGIFNRITYVGNISHFVADVSYYDNRYYNSPYGYYDPYYSPYYSPYSSYYSPFSRGSYYSPYSPYYSPYRQNAVRNEMRQYLIDFETGKVIEYDVKNAEMLLTKDADLHYEYMKLSRKKKREQLFVFIRRFNEKNPLYLPAN